MKIGAMVPQGWRMDLNGINPCLLYTSDAADD